MERNSERSRVREKRGKTGVLNIANGVSRQKYKREHQQQQETRYMNRIDKEGNVNVGKRDSGETAQPDRRWEL